MVLLAAQISGAQQVVRGSWDLVADLRPGQRVRVRQFDGEQVTGTVLRSDEDAVTLVQKRTESRMERLSIESVAVRSTGARVRNAGLAAAGGAGVGLAIGALGLAVTDGSDSAGALLAATTAFGAILGLGIGVVLPGYRTIYRARR
jgi:hypothetical protein